MTIEAVYKKEDIFKNVDEENGTVDMIIPDDVKARMGWKEGDTLVFKMTESGALEVSKKDVDSTEE
tara:strand:+ start:282 stop:479 length:198 start_codon:yes stop_codon:yes gene_type:complete